MLDRLGSALERERRSSRTRVTSSARRSRCSRPSSSSRRDSRAAGRARAALRSAADETDRLVRLAEDLLLVARADRGSCSRLQPCACSRRGASRAVSPRRFEARARDAAGREIEVDVRARPRARCRRGPPRRRRSGIIVDNALSYGGGTGSPSRERGNGVVELHVGDDGERVPAGVRPASPSSASARRRRARRRRHGARPGDRGCDRARSRRHRRTAANLDGRRRGRAGCPSRQRLNAVDASGRDRRDVG